MNISPPALVKGLTTLERALYRQVYRLPAARVSASKVGSLRGGLERDLVLSWPRVKTVLPDPQEEKDWRLLLLNPERISTKSGSFAPINNSTCLKSFEEFGAAPLEYELVLDYAYWSSEEILKATLPDGVDIPGSFETVGHIAHLNLRPEHEEFKHLIGAVILDKNPALKTVVNKVGAIEATFRFFQMELLAGANEMIVEVKEEGCLFRFDYSRVYWNSRLQHEHRRLVALFAPGERVCDLFCGVGPFAIPAAKKGCRVWANDLNPASIEFLKENRRLNKIGEQKLVINNGDARDFVKHSHGLINEQQQTEIFFDHYVMNLPASAHEFLDALDCIRALLKEESKAPRVHCYVFCRAEESPIELVAGKLQVSQVPGAEAHLVRNVAPNKDMYCVHFDLPPLEATGNKKPKLNKLE